MLATSGTTTSDALESQSPLHYSGVEQWQFAWLITRRSGVRISSPQLTLYYMNNRVLKLKSLSLLSLSLSKLSIVL